MHSIVTLSVYTLDITVKATVLMALTGLAAALSRRASAAWRHYVWMLGLITTLSLPLVSSILPRLPLNLPEARQAQSLGEMRSKPSNVQAASPATREPQPVVAANAASVQSGALTDKTRSVVPPQGVVIRDAAPAIAVLFWLIGTLSVLSRWITGGLALRRLVRDSDSVPPHGDDPISVAYRVAIGSLPRTRQPAMLCIATTDLVRTPLTWGWIRPVIALPADAAEWPAERLRTALLHELGHVQRSDWALQRLAHFTCALFWFHPLVWKAARSARAESELACDDLVLAAGVPATSYGRHLLEAAHSAYPATGRAVFGASHAGALAMIPHQPSGVETRLRAILARDRSRGSVSVRLRTGAAFASLLLLLPIAALQSAEQRAETTADLNLGSGVRVRKIDGLTQYISKDFVRAVTDSDHRTVVFFDRAARDNAPARVVSGYTTTLPCGVTVAIVGLVRLAKHAGYWQYADPLTWQTADGASLRNPPISERMIRFGLPPDMTGGIEPVLIVYSLTANATAARDGFSNFLQPMGADQNQEYSWIIPQAYTFGTDSRFGRGSIGTMVYNYALFPKGSRNVAIRSGVAAGPWTIKATKRIAFRPGSIASPDKKFPPVLGITLDDRPYLEYLDSKSRSHRDYFLQAGQRLGAEDRRIVAIDTAGNAIPLDSSIESGGLRQFGVPRVALLFEHDTDRGRVQEQPILLGQVRELRLETRPFQRVEFRNVQIPPQPL